MNFALSTSARVERRMLESLSETVEKPGLVDPADEEYHYEKALSEHLDANHECHAGGDIRIGEFILLADSDTRVVSPSDPQRLVSCSSPTSVACGLPAI